MGLVGALSAQYGSPGKLADNRRQFEKRLGRNIRDCFANIGRESIWGYGSDGVATVTFGVLCIVWRAY